MRRALARAYPPGSSLARLLFRPLIDPWSYLRTVHLLFLFPLGLAYFVVIVVGLATGIGLLITLAGPPLLLATLYVTRWLGDAEAWIVRHLHRMELRRPPTTIERGSYRNQVRARLVDPTSWTGIVYLVLQFPLGILTFSMLVVSTTFGVALVAIPFLGDNHPLINVGDDEVRFVVVDGASMAQRWIAFVAGLALLFAQVHLTNLISALHAGWAALMLGSRAPHIVPGAPLAGPAGPAGPTAPEDAPADDPQPDGFSIDHLAAGGVARLHLVNDHDAGVIASLTPREVEVLRLIARGYSNAEIAEAFVVSEGTVKTHVKRVLAKLDVRDRTQATIWAFDRGLVLPASANVLAPTDTALPEARIRSGA